MTGALAIICGLLVVALIVQHYRFSSLLESLIEDSRIERGTLLNRIQAPEVAVQRSVIGEAPEVEPVSQPVPDLGPWTPPLEVTEDPADG